MSHVDMMWESDLQSLVTRRFSGEGWNMMEEPLSPTSALICRRRISIAHAFGVTLPSFGDFWTVIHGLFMKFSAVSEWQRAQTQSCAAAEVTPYTITTSLRPWPSCTKPI